ETAFACLQAAVSTPTPSPTFGTPDGWPRRPSAAYSSTGSTRRQPFVTRRRRGQFSLTEGSEERRMNVMKFVVGVVGMSALLVGEIGRASCRERVEGRGVA